MTPLLAKLREHLLQLGGEETHVPDDESDAEKILARGRAWDGATAAMRAGLPGRCHQNSIWLWEENRDRMRIATGYALTPDGHWRQHSWCVSVDGGLLFETTEPRLTYFGFVMTEEECEDFFII